MGGGGGGDSRSLGDTTDLERKAKELLRKADSGRKNVFLSFAYEDVDEVNLLRAQAKNENSNLEFNDRSVKEPFDSERADYIRQKIRERINQCSTTVVYLSPDSARSKWVEWEVRKSLELGKRVIGVHAGTKPPSKLPAVVQKNKIKVVPWSRLSRELNKD